MTFNHLIVTFFVTFCIDINLSNLDNAVNRNICVFYLVFKGRSCIVTITILYYMYELNKQANIYFFIYQKKDCSSNVNKLN